MNSRRRAGGPEVLRYGRGERPSRSGPAAREGRRRRREFHRDLRARGVYRVLPFVPARAAGTVEAVGEGVSGSPPATGWPRPRASLLLRRLHPRDADKALPVPAGVDRLTAAALPLQGMTAHYLINSSFQVEPGHTVLLHAGAGGVGLLLIQLLKARGARVITTVSTDEKERWPAEAGADQVLRYDGFAAKVRGAHRRHRRGRGVRRRRQGHLRRLPRRAAHPRHPRALRRRLRAGAARRPAAPQRRRLAVPDPAHA